MKSKEKKPMSLSRKILSAVLKTLIVLLGIVIIAITVFAVMFWDTFVTVVKNPGLIPYVFDNWDSLSKGLTISTEDIEKESIANTEAQAQAFADANINLTKEDIESLADENLTEEERALIIYNAITSGGNAVLTPDNEDDNTDSTGDTEADASDDNDKSDDDGMSENDKPDSSATVVPGEDGKTSDTEDNDASDKPDDKTGDTGAATVTTDRDKPSEGNSGSNTGTTVNTPDTGKPNVSDTDAENSPSTRPVSGNNTGNTGNTNTTSGGNGNSGGGTTNVLIPEVSVPVVNRPSTTVTNSGKDGGTSGTATLTEDQYNMRVAELVAKMYSIKADFVSKLSVFESSIIAQYNALPREQQTNAGKSKLVSENMNYVMGLEAQCDAQVKAVTDELTVLMTTHGKPTTLVDQINAAYVNEKEIKKAYYVSLYK